MEGSGQSLPQDNMSPKYSWQKPWQRVSISVSLSLFNTGCFNHTDFSPLCTPYNTAPQTKTYFHMIYLLKSAASDRELVGEQRTMFYFQIIKFPQRFQQQPRTAQTDITHLSKLSQKHSLTNSLQITTMIQHSGRGVKMCKVLSPSAITAQ